MWCNSYVNVTDVSQYVNRWSAASKQGHCIKLLFDSVQITFYQEVCSCLKYLV